MVDHPDVACAQHNLAVCACETDRTDEAQGLRVIFRYPRERARAGSPDRGQHPASSRRMHRRALGIREEKVG